MFIELLNGTFLNMFVLQNIYIKEDDSSVLCYKLINGSIIEEPCGSASNAVERFNTVKALLTGHLEELKAQVVQLESTVSELETTITDSSEDLDRINGEVV